MSQCTRSQGGALSGGRGEATATKAIFSAGEQEELSTVQVPDLMLTDGGLGRTELVVETTVSQKAGLTMPFPQLQSAPVMIPAESSGPYSFIISTRCAELPVAAGEGAEVGTTVGGGDQVHVKHFDHQPYRRASGVMASGCRAGEG